MKPLYDLLTKYRRRVAKFRKEYDKSGDEIPDNVAYHLQQFCDDLESALKKISQKK